VRQKTTPEDFAVTERENQVVALRLRGVQYRAIGAQVGISGQAAHQIVQRVLARKRKETNEIGEEVRDLEIERLDKMLAILSERIEDDPGDYQAMDRVFRIAERRARLLGLDMPEKHEVHGGLTIEGLDAILETARAAKGEE
jgi:hypothetical protein